MIKSFFFGLVFLMIVLSCSSDDNRRNNNPYLVDVNFSMTLNLNFPEYNNLNFPGNAYTTYNYGLKGVVVYNINNSQYTAFELTDPNHTVSNCSRLTVEGIIATCNCEDGNSYNIITGELSEGTGQHSLKPYRVRKSGNVIEVYN